MKHLYCNDVTEWFVAETREEAIELARKWYADVVGEPDPDEEVFDLKQEPDDKTLECSDEDADADTTTVKTCGEWAEESDSGFWGTTEV